MIANPLSENITLPSEIQSVFVRAFEHAAEEPSVESIKPIYRMLKGTSTMLIGLLSSTVLLRFEEQLFSILRDIKGDNQSLCLYCVAIMNVLSSASDDRVASFADSYDTQELLASAHVTPSRWTPDTIRQYFVGGKAPKTMQLVALRSMWACTLSTREPLDEKIEALSLANEIVAAVPADVRESWRKATPIIVRKVEEKALAPGLDTGLQLQSLCFLLRLTEDHVHPATALDTLRHMLTRVMVNTGLCNSFTDDISYLTHCGVLDQSTTTIFLQNAVDFATSAPITDIIGKIASLQQLLDGLCNAMVERDAIIEGTMLAIDVLSCGQKLQMLAKLCQTLNFDHRSSVKICQHAAQIATKGLIQSLSRVFLTAALSSRQSTYSISNASMKLLLELHASSAQRPPPCTHIRRHQISPDTTTSFVESSSTPNAIASDWRAALQSHLHLRNEQDRQVLSTLFARSCAELEDHCKTIDQPLREGKEKRDFLQQRYDDLNQAYTTMQSDNIDRNIQFNAMEMERDQCMSDLNTAREENENLVKKIEEVERGSRQAKAEAEQTMVKIRKEMEMTELEHAAALTRKEEELEEMHERMLASANELKCKSEELEGAQLELQNLRSMTESLRNEIDALAASEEELRTARDLLQDEQSDLVRRRNDQEAELQNVKQQLHTARETHQLEIVQLQKEAEDERARFSASKDQLIAETNEQHENAKVGLLQQIEDLKHQHQQATDERAAETKRMGQESVERQKKIDRLKAKCEQKDRQIAEANEMRSNLMAAMGISGNMPKQTRLPNRSLASFAVETQSQDMDTQADPSPPKPLSGNDDETQQRGAETSFASNASSTDSRSGPTPKRARPRRTLRVASPAKSRMSTGVATRSTRKSAAASIASNRQPLSSVSSNQGQMGKFAAKTPCKASVQAAASDGMDESTFDGSELFAGTPGQQMLDLDCGLDENTAAR